MVRAKAPVTGICSSIATRPARVLRSASRGSLDVQGSIVSKKIWLFENEAVKKNSSSEDLSDTCTTVGCATGCYKHRWWLSTNLLPAQLCTKCNKRLGTKKAVHKCTVCKHVFHLKCASELDERNIEGKISKTNMDMKEFVLADVSSGVRRPCQVPKTKKRVPFSRMPRHAVKQTPEINNNIPDKLEEEEIVEESVETTAVNETQCSNKSQTKQKLAGMKSSFVKRCRSLKKKVKCIKEKVGSAEDSQPQGDDALENCDIAAETATELEERAEEERAALAKSPVLKRVRSRQAEIRAEFSKRRAGPYKKDNRGRRKIVFDADLSDIRDRLDVVEKQLNTLTKEVPAEIREWYNLGLQFRNDYRGRASSQDPRKHLSHAKGAALDLTAPAGAICSGSFLFAMAIKETHPKELEANGYPSVSSTTTTDDVYIIAESSSSLENEVPVTRLEAKTVHANPVNNVSDGSGQDDSSLLPSGIPNRLKLDIMGGNVGSFSDHQTSTPVTNCELSFRSASKEYAKMQTISHKNVTMINMHRLQSDQSSCKLPGGNKSSIRDSEMRNGESSTESSQRHVISPTHQMKVLSPEQLAVRSFLEKRKRSNGSFSRSPSHQLNLSGSPPIASSTFRNGEPLNHSILQSDMSPVSFTLQHDRTDGSQFSFAKVRNESKLHYSKQLSEDPHSPVLSELSYTFRNDSQMMPAKEEENLPGYTTNHFTVAQNDNYTESESEVEGYQNASQIQVEADIEIDDHIDHERLVSQDTECATSVDGTSFTNVTEFSTDEANSFYDKNYENKRSRWINKDVFMFGEKGNIRKKREKQQCFRAKCADTGYVDEMGDGRKPPVSHMVSSTGSKVDFLKEAENHLELYQSRRKKQELTSGVQLERLPRPRVQTAVDTGTEEESDATVEEEVIIPVTAKSKNECFKSNETHEFEEMEKRLKDESLARRICMSKSLTDITESVTPRKEGPFGRSISCTSSIDGETRSIINESAKYHFLHEKGMIKISSPGLKLVKNSPTSRRGHEINDIEEEDSTDLAETGSESDINDFVIDNKFSLVRSREMSSSHSETSENFTQTSNGDIYKQQRQKEAELLEEYMRTVDNSQDSWDNVLNWIKRDDCVEDDEELHDELRMMIEQQEEVAGPNSGSGLEESVYYSFQAQSEEQRNVRSPSHENAEAGHQYHEETDEEWSLMELVQHGTPRQVEQLLNSDRTISECEIKEAAAWALEQEIYDISLLLLQDICRLLVAAEGDNCVEAFPAYREGYQWEPLFVVLSKQNFQGEWDSFMGFHVYRRRYDAVSPEAAMVINSELVQNNPLSLDDFKKVKHAISSASLHDRHGQITVINACPFRSKRGGEVLEKGLCIVVHCWIKGFIPFNEEPFPEQIEGIPVDVREGYVRLGGSKSPRPKTTKPAERLTDGKSMSRDSASQESGSNRSVCQTGSQSGASLQVLTNSSSTASVQSLLPDDQDRASRTLVPLVSTDIDGDMIMGTTGDDGVTDNNLDKVAVIVLLVISMAFFILQ